MIYDIRLKFKAYIIINATAIKNISTADVMNFKDSKGF